MDRNQAGIVDSLQGDVRVIHADGSTDVLQTGSPVFADDVIVTGDNARASILLLDGSTLNVGPEFSARLDDALLPPPDSLPESPGIETPGDLEETIRAGGDPTEVTEPPAAGEAVQADSGISFVRLDPSNLAVTPDSGFETTAVGYGFTGIREELLQSPPSDGSTRDATDLDLHVADEATNLVIVLDKSSSMLADPGVQGYATRFDLAKDALQQLFEAYDSNSDVNVLVVDFSSANLTFNSGWLALSDAMDYLDGVQVRGFTDYRAALLQVREAFNADSDPAPAASQSVVYFLSDGDPLGLPGQGGGALSATDVAAWESFLSEPNNNITRAYALGIGDGLRPLEDPRNQLDEVAFPNDDPDNPVILDEAELVAGLVERVETNTVSGNLVSETGASDRFDAGGVQLVSLKVDGTTYSYDPVADQITGGTGGPVNGSVLTVVTGLGADLEFDFASADYSYRVPEVDTDSREVFFYTVTDARGRTGTADFTVHVAEINPDTPVSRITGGGGIDVIYGTRGDDILNGGGGDDILVGRLGVDQLTGGSGADTFVFQSTTDGPDNITDYSEDEQDVLDISGILAGADPDDILANIDEYLSATTDGSDTRIAVDPGGGWDFTEADIAVLAGVNTGQVNLAIDEDTQTSVDIV